MGTSANKPGRRPVRYAPEPQRDVDWLGHPLDVDFDDESWWEPAPGWSEWAWEGPNRRLIVNGRPPPPSRVTQILTEPDITGLMINELEPGHRDLHWLEPEALLATTMREFQVGPIGARVDVSRLRDCRCLDVVAVASRLSRTVDFGQWSSAISSLGITQGSPQRYVGIEALQQLTFLAVDLPGASIDYVGQLPSLRELSLTAARQLGSLPLKDGQPVERLTVHQAPSLDLSCLTGIGATLTEMELDGVKAVVNGEAIRSCRALKTLTIENTGPSVSVDDILALLHEASLTKVFIAGARLPFSRAEGARLANEAPPSTHISVPPL